MKRRYMTLVVSAAVAFLFLCAAAINSSAQAEGSFQRTLEVTGAVNLDITTGSGNIAVSTSLPESLPRCAASRHFSQPSARQVQVIGCIRASNLFGEYSGERVKLIEANPPIERSGNDIRIGHIDDPDLRNHISISYFAIVPPDTALRAHTGSGSALIQGLRQGVDASSGSGSLRVSDIGDEVRTETGSGDINLDTVRGHVRAKTGSGSIRATAISGGFEGSTGSGTIHLEQTAAGAVWVQTGSGNLDLEGVHGSLQATTGSGSIRVAGNPSGAWTLHTGSGSVELRVAPEASFNLHAHTGSGGIAVREPLTLQGEIKRQDVTGKVGGGGVPVNVESGSGSIEID